jgi:GTP-binding protein
VFNPKFVKSAAQPKDFPADEGREVAFVGRSNSGKSSAINALVGSRKLARVSKTPGRTQLINFFEVAPGRRFVDLPGYGFARVAPDVRQRWRALLEGYFAARRSLAGLVVTMDIRRGLTPLDETMLDWAAELDTPIAVLLTKSDKLSRGAAVAPQRKVAERLGGGVELVRFSATRRDGVAEARRWLAERLELAWTASGPARIAQT